MILRARTRKLFRPASRDWGFTAAWLREAVRRERGVT